MVALDAQFGEPVDAYVNGSQTWLRDDGPGGETVEWRLHPVAGYRRPDGIGTYEVFGAVALALGTGATPPAPPEQLWEGLEAFPAYLDEGGDAPEPAVLAAACTTALGIAPDASGIVDHEPIGDAVGGRGGPDVDPAGPLRPARRLDPRRRLVCSGAEPPWRALERRSPVSPPGWGRGGSKWTSRTSPRMAAKAIGHPEPGAGERPRAGRPRANQPTSAHSSGWRASSPPMARQWNTSGCIGTRVKPRRSPSSTAMRRTGSQSMPVSSCTSFTATSDAE